MRTTLRPSQTLSKQANNLLQCDCGGAVTCATSNRSSLRALLLCTWVMEQGRSPLACLLAGWLTVVHNNCRRLRQERTALQASLERLCADVTDEGERMRGFKAMMAEHLHITALDEQHRSREGTKVMLDCSDPEVILIFARLPSRHALKT